MVKPTTNSLYFRYFVYSSEEESLRMKLYGNNAKFGTVVVRGISKRYTSILSDMSNARADAIIITKGDIRRIKYTAPE